ncbi:MAG: class I adenylate-forming enzyme family protein [Pseudonocardia sp.]
MSPQSYRDLVPTELRRSWSAAGIYPDVPVFTLFDRFATTDPARPAVLDAEGSVTYGELRELALRFAGGLAAHGVGVGDVIAAQLPNSRYSCVVDLAAAAMGAVVLPFPAGRGRRDIASLLTASRARVVVITATHDGFDVRRTVESLRRELADLELVVLLDDLAAVLAPVPLDRADQPAVDPDNVVRVLVSSGSESTPKLVAYSHNALVGGRGQFLSRLQRDGEHMRGMFLVPLGSSFGSCATFGVLCTLGGTLVLRPGFSVTGTLKAVAEDRPTHLFGVPTMFQRLLASPLLADTDISSLVAVVSGGAIIDPPTAAGCARDLGSAFVSLYGSADGVNCHTLLDDDIAVAQHTVGRPNAAVCSIRIVDADGRDCPDGGSGEVLARGPLSPHCYVNDPVMDARHRTADGWVRTGDLGMIDNDGRLRLVGRKKDVVIRGGANISPAEVEGLLAEHPAVLGVVCVGIDDPDLGQRLCACVMPAPHADPLTLPDLQEFLRSAGLEPRKFPEQLVVSAEFPLTPAGKVDKAALVAGLDTAVNDQAQVTR